MQITLLNKTYDDESLDYIDRDVYEVFDIRMTPQVADIPKNDYGGYKGTFHVTVVWHSDAED